MAGAVLGEVQEFVDKRKSTAANAASSTSLLGTPLNYTDITKLKARLTAINAGLYTAARLNTMTLNDLIYALRTLDDAAGI